MEYEYYHLFSPPSFIEGMCRTLDIGGKFASYNYDRTPEDADMAAIYSDWLAIGKDLQRVVGNGQEKNK
ncbi:hypothetical protein DRH14_04455 [Candidatus Shapirobacteria bacterium]|nr:MAG: hypothetical protein DRH14_04455 [Candidatus Shapirobacteria bacterium]